MNQSDIDHIRGMRRSGLANYAIPGLSSYLIGGTTADHGCVRLFECSRNHDEIITPHSHRFDFRALVLEGSVNNLIWTETSDDTADMFQQSVLHYEGRPGEYRVEPGPATRWRNHVQRFTEGDWYGMKSNEVHSIFFSRGAKVLFLEGSTVSTKSIILEPFVDGRRIPTFKTEPWMFQAI